MKIVMVLGTDNRQRSALADKIARERGYDSMHCPPDDLHASLHGDALDAQMEWAKGCGGAVIRTHSKAVFTRLVLRVVENIVSPDDVEIVWADTGRVMKILASGGIEGAKENPPPKMFGEEAFAADLKAMNEAFILRANAGQAMKIVQEQRIDGQTGKPLPETMS